MTKFQLQTLWFKLTNRFRKNKVIFDEDYIHEYFELSYAHYLVLPRTLLQSMPSSWQKDFVKLLEGFEERFTRFEWLPENTNYNVQLKDNKGKIHSIKEDIFNDYERGRRFVESYKFEDNHTGEVFIRNGCKEWYCKHGVGHYVEKIKPDVSTVHGCDGCCSQKEIVERDLKANPKPKYKPTFI